MKGKAKETRSDSWEAQLTKVQQWELYYKMKQMGTWVQATKWAVQEYGLKRMPGMTAFYRWKSAMRKMEFEQKAEDTKAGCAATSAIAKRAPSDKEIVAALKSLGMQAALDGDVARTAILFKCVGMANNCILQEAVLEQKKCMCEIQKGRHDIERRRFEIFDRKENPPPLPPMSPEEREAKIKEIFGLDKDYQIH